MMAIQFRQAVEPKPVEVPKPSGHGKRGRPPSGKVRISILLDPEIIEMFRAAGNGWQARMNAALKKAVP